MFARYHRVWQACRSIVTVTDPHPVAIAPDGHHIRHHIVTMSVAIAPSNLARNSHHPSSEEGTMIVICGHSAWEYHCTPPVVRDTELSAEIATAPPPQGAGFPPYLLKHRSNASDAARLLSGRLLFDLKNVTLPIRVFVDDSSSLDRTKLVDPSRMPHFLPCEELMKLGGGLYVTSPRLTLLQLARELSWQHLALKMMEACGIHATTRYTLRAGTMLKELESFYATSMSSLARTPTVAEYCDETGVPVKHVDAEGNPVGWTPCINRFGQLTDLWKRPPLTNAHDLMQIIAEAGRTAGAVAAKTAATQIQDGSGSPFESRLLMLLCCSRKYGGEQWERPSLNRRVEFTKEAQELASGQSHCVCDLLWAEKKVVIEANGKSYHADREGFDIENGRRTALESMGYAAIDVSYRQIADMDRLESMLGIFSNRLGFPLQSRTNLFIARKKELHNRLFRFPKDAYMPMESKRL